MKNAINYYYNLNPTEIHQINKKIKFRYNNKNYILEPFTRNIEELKEIYELEYYLTQLQFNSNLIVLNTNKEILTMINGINYIMIETKYENQKIDINDILIFNNLNVDKNKFNKIKRENWYNLWINKIDYLEYQISQFGKKYKLIRESSAYFIGIAENCIQLLSTINKENYRLTISHNRTYNKMTKSEYYNPTSFIIDNITRDIAEYTKDSILNDIDVNSIIERYIYYNKLNEQEIKLMFIRILYPSYYIDMCENILEGKKDEIELKNILNKIDIIEGKIKEIYLKLKKITNLPDIEWLIN